MGQHCTHDYLDHFTKCIIDFFMPKCLRKRDYKTFKVYMHVMVGFMGFRVCLEALGVERQPKIMARSISHR